MHEYIVITRKSTGELAKAVEDFMDAGFTLVGGLAIRETDEGPIFCQALHNFSQERPIIQLRTEEGVMEFKTG